jgi:hypothetical protein
MLLDVAVVGRRWLVEIRKLNTSVYGAACCMLIADKMHDARSVCQSCT